MWRVRRITFSIIRNNLSARTGESRVVGGAAHGLTRRPMHAERGVRINHTRIDSHPDPADAISLNF